MAEASKGQYKLFATESEDERAKSVFEDMAEDMERHVAILESRLEYLDKHNSLNTAGGDQAQGKKKDNQKGQQQRQG